MKSIFPALSKLTYQVPSLRKSLVWPSSGTQKPGGDFRQRSSYARRTELKKRFPPSYGVSHLIVISDNCDYSMYSGSISLADCLCYEGS